MVEGYGGAEDLVLNKNLVSYACLKHEAYLKQQFPFGRQEVWRHVEKKSDVPSKCRVRFRDCIRYNSIISIFNMEHYKRSSY